MPQGGRRQLPRSGGQDEQRRRHGEARDHRQTVVTAMEAATSAMGRGEEADVGEHVEQPG